MKQLAHIKNHLQRNILASVIIAIVAAFTIVPAAVFAWGPDRTTFTQENPADYVTFNSITNNPKWGDERNFMRIRDVASGETFRDVATLQPGKKYEVLVLYHNNAKSALNASGQGIAQGAYARTEIPALVRSGASNVSAQSFVGAANAKPTAVYDHVSLNNPTNADIALRYVKGTAKITSNGAINGKPIGEELFGNGAQLGYEALNGSLPGCDQYSGYITYQLVADSPGFTFAKDVRVAGTKEWKDSLTAPKGTKLEYRLSYANTGTTEQKNVVMKDVLPKGLTYVPGETDVANTSAPNGKRVGDGINGDGIDIGSYAGGANAFLYLFATVDAEPCTVLRNTAAVETRNGNLQDTATVTVEGECTEMTTVDALPTTGPAEVIIGMLGLAAVTFGIVYYFKSRRELQQMLHAVQSSSVHVSSRSVTTDHTKTEKTPADHTSHKTPQTSHDTTPKKSAK